MFITDVVVKKKFDGVKVSGNFVSSKYEICFATNMKYVLPRSVYIDGKSVIFVY